jgi:hypothetical protein
MVGIGQNGTMLLHPEIEAITASMPTHSFPEMDVDEARHAHAAGAAGRPKGPDMADVSEFDRTEEDNGLKAPTSHRGERNCGHEILTVTEEQDANNCCNP